MFGVFLSCQCLFACVQSYQHVLEGVYVHASLYTCLCLSHSIFLTWTLFQKHLTVKNNFYLPIQDCLYTTSWWWTAGRFSILVAWALIIVHYIKLQPMRKKNSKPWWLRFTVYCKKNPYWCEFCCPICMTRSKTWVNQDSFLQEKKWLKPYINLEQNNVS